MPGAAGVIGGSLVDRLLAVGIRVVGYDNPSTGVAVSDKGRDDAPPCLIPNPVRVG